MKRGATEASQVALRLLEVLETVPVDITTAAEFRHAIGKLKATVEVQADDPSIPADLDAAFSLALESGGTVERFDRVRLAAEKESPAWLLGKAMVAAFLRLSLVYQAKAIARLTIRSRQDVERYLNHMNEAFRPAEDYAADNKETDAWQQLVALHGAVTRDLLARARPLPRVVHVQFARSFPWLVLGQKLYTDASRAEEIRLENRAINPLFMPLAVRALSE
jgi:hypothetical protein